MGSPAFSQVVAAGSDVCCTYRVYGRLLLLQTVCPVAGRAVAAGKSSFFIYSLMKMKKDKGRAGMPESRETR